MSIMKTAHKLANSAIDSSRNIAGKLAKILPSKERAAAFGLAAAIALGGASKSDADIVFDAVAIDGSFGQPSVLDAGGLSHGLQPFEVTPALASANGIEYNGAFSANPVLLPGNILTGLDVRTWSTGFIYLSNATDALNGTPTARALFNPLEATAPNGQQFQDLIIETEGENGERHHTFDPVANLGFSQENNPYHQITETLDMNTTLIIQDNSTTTLGSFLADNEGQTLYGSSIINNATSGGSYNIAATPNLGQDGIIFNQQGGFEVEAGFAHSFEGITASVPEPSSIPTLATLAAAAMVTRRRREGT